MRILRAMFGWLANRWVLSVIGLILLSVLIWLFGDEIAIGGWEPFGTDISKLIAILILVVIWAVVSIVKVVRAQRTNAQVVNDLAVAPQDSGPDNMVSAEEVAALRERFREALTVLKKAKLGGKGGRRQLYQLPWYMIIGPPGAGKTTALKNSGLKFPLTDKFGDDAIRGVGGTRNCDWWFTDEAVLLDTAGRYTTQDSDKSVDSASWGGFLQLLKKHRRRRPIDGVLVAISLTDLATGGADQRQYHALAVRKRLQELQSQLQVKVPIYVVFTKCDLISGFVEFFDDLGREEREQVWGTTFPISVSETQGGPIESFGPEFDTLIARMDERLLGRLNQERDPRRRNKILGFSQQMASLKGVLQEFMSEAFHPSRFEEPILVRGAYFCSGTQEGTPIDRILSSVSSTFGLDRQAMPAFSGSGRSYFLTRTLRDVVFQEADLVGDMSIWARHRKWIDLGAYTAAVVVVLALTAAWITSYIQNQSYIGDMTAKITDYEKVAQASTRGSGALLEMLAPLNALRAFPGGYDDRDKSVPLAMGFGLYQGDKLGAAARGAYRRALNTVMLPRLLDRLEVQMRQNADRPDILYEGLKAYLMLGDPKRLNPVFVKDWISLDWELRLPGPTNEPARKQLGAHLTALLGDDMLPLPLNGTLVKDAREVLAQRPLSERVYLQVKSEVSFERPDEWRITDYVRGATRYMRRRNDALLTKGIPGIFTYNGYKEKFLVKLPGLAARAADEAWVMGPEYNQKLGESEVKELTTSVLDLYFKEYVLTWKKFVNDIEPVPFRTFNEAAEITKVLSGPESPLKRLIAAITNETKLVRTIPILDKLNKRGGGLTKDRDRLRARLGLRAGEIKTPIVSDPAMSVNREFEKLHQILEAPKGEKPPMDRILAVLDDLFLHFGSLRDNASAPVKADSIARLRIEADRHPEPVKRWLRATSRHASLMTVGSARRRLNQIWTGDIAPHCVNTLANRFPMSRSSRENANLNDFARYFGPQGLVKKFVDKNIKPYVDTAVRPWKPRNRGGARIPIPNDALAKLEGADWVRRAFFASGSPKPSVEFTLRVDKLDRDVRKIEIQLGDNQRLSNRHERGRARTMRWPPPGGGSMSAQVIFTTFEGGPPPIIKADGPWALFRLLDDRRVKLRPIRSDRFEVTFTAAGRSARLILNATDKINPFRLRSLKGFGCLARL